jgi:uncharacterized protein
MRITEGRGNVSAADEYCCCQGMIPQPLTDAEVESLSGVLERFGGKDAMNVEQLDGFLAAVICCPSEISETEYLPEIWGDETISEKAFLTQPVLHKFISLVTRHKESVAHTLQSGEVYTPVILANDDGAFLGNDWARGFMRGMGLRHEDWVVLLEDEDHGGSLVPILALAHEHDPDPEMRPYKEPISIERRENLLVGVAAGVMNIYKYFRNRQKSAKAVFSADVETYRRFGPKTGRNEPCPCGSGKKFKHCCGKVTLH